MPFFVVTLVHPDGGGWDKHVAAHVKHLRQLLDTGELRASGPTMGGPHRTGLLIFKAADRASVEGLMARDPFAINGLITSMTITEWDPLLGAFAAESTGLVGGRPM